MVVGRGLRIIALATGFGVAAAWAGARLLQSQLFGVSATDLVTFIAVPVTLAAGAVLACWAPARRAARVDPVIALQSE